MKKSFSILLYTVIILCIPFPTTNAFVKLIPVGSKVNINYSIRTFNISYIFHQPTSVTNQSLEFQIDIKRSVKDVKLQLVYHGLTKNGTVSSVLLKRQVDLCAFLRNTKSDRLLKSVYDYINERSIIPTRCPFAPGRYYMCNIRFADVPVPAFLPESDFILDIVYYSQVRSETLVEFRLRGRLVRIVQKVLL
ncbi:uncharacterized protein LOC118506223 [Anopheles stephensi]|uniref:uncharacterized protein LOC118506223 n=1 Tax=Anopheles stephensi TaxID=30069 RepID=UPI001658B45B|nr:uncharacterized protein LOC118506223 [Anopheles stephensi]